MPLPANIGLNTTPAISILSRLTDDKKKEEMDNCKQLDPGNVHYICWVQRDQHHRENYSQIGLKRTFFFLCEVGDIEISYRDEFAGDLVS